MPPDDLTKRYTGPAGAVGRASPGGSPVAPGPGDDEDITRKEPATHFRLLKLGGKPVVGEDSEDTEKPEDPFAPRPDPWDFVPGLPGGIVRPLKLSGSGGGDGGGKGGGGGGGGFPKEDYSAGRYYTWTFWKPPPINPPRDPDAFRRGWWFKFPVLDWRPPDWNRIYLAAQFGYLNLIEGVDVRVSLESGAEFDKEHIFPVDPIAPKGILELHLRF
jgi:hypothetical protein